MSSGDEDIHETIQAIAQAVVDSQHPPESAEIAGAIADAICDHFAGDRPWFPSLEARRRAQRDQRIAAAVQQLGSCPPVAERFGLSRSRVHQIVKREGIQLRGSVQHSGGALDRAAAPSAPDSDE